MVVVATALSVVGALSLLGHVGSPAGDAAAMASAPRAAGPAGDPGRDDTSRNSATDPEQEPDLTCQEVIETASGGYVCADGVPENERHLLDEGVDDPEPQDITVRAALAGDCGFLMQREVFVYDGFEELVGHGRYTEGEYDSLGRCVGSARIQIPYRPIYRIDAQRFDGSIQYLMTVTWDELEANGFVAG